MDIKLIYTELRGDYEDALKRLMNEPMLLRFIKKFPDDPSMNQLREAVKNEDIESSFRAVHTLKSVAGVLGFTELAKVSINLTEQLRPRLDQADKELFAAVDKEYEHTMSVLKKYFSQEP